MLTWPVTITAQRPVISSRARGRPSPSRAGAGRAGRPARRRTARTAATAAAAIAAAATSTGSRVWEATRSGPAAIIRPSPMLDAHDQREPPEAGAEARRKDGLDEGAHKSRDPTRGSDAVQRVFPGSRWSPAGCRSSTAARRRARPPRAGRSRPAGAGPGLEVLDPAPQPAVLDGRAVVKRSSWSHDRSEPSPWGAFRRLGEEAGVAAVSKSPTAVAAGQRAPARRVTARGGRWHSGRSTTSGS